MTYSIKDTQHNWTLSVTTLSIMLSVIMLNAVMLSVVLPNIGNLMREFGELNAGNLGT
jgi:hypothetical protein